MTTTYQTFGDVPTVLLHTDDVETSARKGCVLCFHGLTSSKDDWLHELAKIARRGFLVVGVDNVGHGERRYADFDTRFNDAKPEFYSNFLDAVERTARDLPPLLDALTEAGLLVENRVGILGVSMGGYIAYRAVALEPRIRAVVTIVASPEWLEHPQSPHRDLEAFAKVKLLSQTAGKDEVVPSRYARAFHERLKEAYADYDERFAYIDYPDSNHQLNPDWKRCWARAIAWLEEHLAL